MASIPEKAIYLGDVHDPVRMLAVTAFSRVFVLINGVTGAVSIVDSVETPDCIDVERVAVLKVGTLVPDIATGAQPT
jgi:hypothetical protein